MAGPLGVIHGVVQTALDGIRTVGSTFFALPFRLRFIFIWLLALLFLLFNAEALYKDSAARQTTVLLLYLVSLAFVFSQTRVTNPLLGISAAEFILTFLLWFAVGAFVFKTFAPFTPADHPTLSGESILVLVTHAVVVAIGEELLFRFALPSMIPGPPMAGQTISAAAFGVMHWAAYGGSIPNVLFASVLGLFFGAIVVRVPRVGLIIAMALHFAFNAFVLGFI